MTDHTDTDIEPMNMNVYDVNDLRGAMDRLDTERTATLELLVKVVSESRWNSSWNRDAIALTAIANGMLGARNLIATALRADIYEP